MLICDRAKIAFAQIPKNGSKSIRKALDDTFGFDHTAFAEDLGWSVAQFEHAYATGSSDYLPALGKNNLDHLTLEVYREHLPGTYAAFCAADSFALIRSPRERFLSAVMQRLGQFRDMKTVRVDDPIVRDEALHVCDWLDARSTFMDKQYVHFTRQIEYVELDGARVVNAIFPIERTDAVEAWIAKLTGQQIGIPHQHARREPKALARVLQPTARFVGRTLIPRSVKKAIYPLWHNSGLFDDAAKRYGTVALDADVETFVDAYYAADFALHEEAVATVRQSALNDAA